MGSQYLDLLAAVENRGSTIITDAPLATASVNSYQAIMHIFANM